MNACRRESLPQILLLWKTSSNTTSSPPMKCLPFTQQCHLWRTSQKVFFLDSHISLKLVSIRETLRTSTKYVVSAFFHENTRELYKESRGFPNPLWRKNSLKIRKGQSISSHIMTWRTYLCQSGQKMTPSLSMNATEFRWRLPSCCIAIQVPELACSFQILPKPKSMVCVMRYQISYCSSFYIRQHLWQFRILSSTFITDQMEKKRYFSISVRNE